MIGWVLSFFTDLFYGALLIGGAALFLAALFAKPILLAVAPPLALSPLVQPVRAVGKAIGLCAALYGLWHLGLAQHDAVLQAKWEAAQRAAVESALAEQREKNDVALAELARETQKMEASSRAFRTVVIQHDDHQALSRPVTDVLAELLRRQSCARGDKAACATSAAAPVRSPGNLAVP